MRRALLATVVLTAVAASLCMPATPALAHAGEDHGEAPPPPSANADTRSASATTTALEIVARWPARAAADGPLRFRFLLSDYATNAPIEAAAIEATLATPNKPDVIVKPQATKSPGIYEADVTLPADAHYALSATIVAGELVDVVAISDIDVGPPPAAADAPHEHGPSRAWIVVAVLALIIVVGIVVALTRRRKRKRTSVAAATAAMLLLAAGVARAHGDEDHGEQKPTAAATTTKPGRVALPKESQFLLGVRTMIVEKRALADRVIVPGVITAPPERHAVIFTPQSGRLTPPPGGFPQLGARIKKGQRLGAVEAVLSASERASFSSEEARGRADASAAAARLDAAEKALARLQSLTGVASRQEIEAASVEVATARAALAEAQARQGAFSTQAGTQRFELVSPLDGVLADVNVSPGEVLNEGERAFLVIDPTVLTVEAKVPEHELARLRDSSDALVSVDAFPGKSFAGKLIAEAQIIDETTRTSKVIFTVDNSDGFLKLGMFARVQIGAGNESSVVAVPDAAVLDIDGRRVVYLHVAPEEFEARELALGRRDGEMHEVLRGLDGGERVVTVGAYTLRSAQAR